MYVCEGWARAVEVFGDLAEFIRMWVMLKAAVLNCNTCGALHNKQPTSPQQEQWQLPLQQEVETVAIGVNVRLNDDIGSPASPSAPH